MDFCRFLSFVSSEALEDCCCCVRDGSAELKIVFLCFTRSSELPNEKYESTPSVWASLVHAYCFLKRIRMFSGDRLPGFTSVTRLSTRCNHFIRVHFFILDVFRSRGSYGLGSSHIFAS